MLGGNRNANKMLAGKTDGSRRLLRRRIRIDGRIILN
jgi:hypothetical protein